MKSATHIAILLFMLISSFAEGQNCTGNLGINIFEDGDFGSGTPNISPDFQNIAPGYGFTFDPPPNDGQFTVTNGTQTWGSFASRNWFRVSDNSGTDEGYMMLVNASFEPGLFYEQQIDGLCENTLFEFSADVINVVAKEQTNHIKPNITFLIDDQPLFRTGQIPQDEKWYTKSFTFSTAPGQTSVKLSLQNNAPGGFGNDLAIDNISFRACGPEALILPREIEQICEDGSPIVLEATVIGSQYPDLAIQWQRRLPGNNQWEDIPGETTLNFTHTDLSGGNYYYRYLLANGSGNLSNRKCRVISNIKEIYVQPKFFNFQDSLCEGTFVQFDGEQLSQSGIYVDSLISSIGCDSIVTYDLTFMPDREIAVDYSLQTPECIEWVNGEFIINDIANGTPPYAVILDGDSLANLLPLNMLGIGIYSIKILDRYLCEWEDDFQIAVTDPFFVDLGNDLSVELGDIVTLNSNPTQTISKCDWNVNQEIENTSDCNAYSFSPPGNSQVILNAQTGTGCIATDTLNIEVLDVRKVYIPSAFSPNNDGINDEFVVYGDMPNVQMIESFSIFDRWGNLIFRKENFLPNELENGWDGTWRGAPLDIGIYAYVAEVRFIDDLTKVYSGDVTIVR